MGKGRKAATGGAVFSAVSQATGRMALQRQFSTRFYAPGVERGAIKAERGRRVASVLLPLGEQFLS